MATWPNTLPLPMLSGYEMEVADTTSRTDMESGSARVRRRSTSGPDGISLRLQLTEAEMVIFRAFWENEWNFGAAWVFFPVRTGRTVGISSKECRPTSGKYKASLVKNSYWQVQIGIEVRND